MSIVNKITDPTLVNQEGEMSSYFPFQKELTNEVNVLEPVNLRFRTRMMIPVFRNCDRNTLNTFDPSSAERYLCLSNFERSDLMGKD